MELLAHINEKTGIKQGLFEHLLNCANYAKVLGDDIGASNICFLIAILHDVGKSSEVFQKYLYNNSKQKVIHSSMGARFIEYISEDIQKNILKNKKIEDKEKKLRSLYKNLLQYCILAHHGLFDIITDDNNRIDKRVFSYNNQDERKAEKIFYKEFFQWIYKMSKDSLENFYEKGYKEFCIWIEKKKELLQFLDNKGANVKKAEAFYDGCMMRLLLSILKEVDIYDSSNYDKAISDNRFPKEEVNMLWEKFCEQTTKLYKSFEKHSAVSHDLGTQKNHRLNCIRSILANEVLEKAYLCSNGNYKLDMPVGSGKTYAALRFVVENARFFKKKRVFYTTAYLSVLEQNAEEIKAVLTDAGKKNEYEKYILEHHSNVIDETSPFDINQLNEQEDEYHYINYLKESWEAPFILTTVVQLSNTLFKNKSASIRRFSKLINSTIIIDEIQSLPIKTMYINNLMFNFLAKFMNVTIVHCTATPPCYDLKGVLEFPCYYGNLIKESEENIITSLSNKINTLNPVFSRVLYKILMKGENNEGFTTAELVSHIANTVNLRKSVLVVLNTKRAVEELYNALKEYYDETDTRPLLYYLTTNQCAAHRLDIIKDIKGRLKSNDSYTPIICISTRLIEAGVDLDFDVVYRSLIGIASIIQSAGRCNREGKLSNKGIVYIIKYIIENLSYLQEFKMEQNATLLTLKDQKLNFDKEDSSFIVEKSLSELLDLYFDELYKLIKNKTNLFSYPVFKGSNTLLDLLSINRSITNACALNQDTKEKVLRIWESPMKQSFKTAGEQFQLIEDNSISVIVPYKNKELLAELDDLIDRIQKNSSEVLLLCFKILLQRLQRNTINIQKYVIKEYEPYLSTILDGKIYLLSEEGYDYSKGLIKGYMNELIY
ncbi:CRISPR-associated endonuclease Cas3'' [Veillonella sp. R32]|uniref:CRISPR-associated endonuclease Cas3'' n=1 Tax=Veillonella sp. R32 TaxID=2021312 RepID=UPI001389ACF9|nr:CRISPR-associated endonuclease Cas3'' [Veillonella sp. R32]KAF1679123.1 CRISPR-associated endonuclease Cas3'' [Veillonella sp. R32]